MGKELVGIIKWIDLRIMRSLVKMFYPQYKRPINGYITHYQVLWRFFFMQKIVGFNRKVPWPVDFRSKILGWEFIEKGIMTDPGDNLGTYINAYGGLKIGDNVEFGPNITIVTTNHDKYDGRKISAKRGVIIGNNVWIGANCVILPGCKIGDEVTIGAGCVIDCEVPSKSTVTRGVGHIQVKPKSRDYEWDIYKEELT